MQILSQVNAFKAECLATGKYMCEEESLSVLGSVDFKRIPVFATQIWAWHKPKVGGDNLTYQISVLIVVATTLTNLH